MCLHALLNNNFTHDDVLTLKKFRHQPSMDLRGRFALSPKIYIGYDKNEPIFGRE
jgi:hypothetical protein